MAELVTELLPLLRNAREFMDAAVSAQRGMPDTGLEPYLPQAELVAIEEMAVHVYSRALAVLKEARRRRARWWFV
jgi:hypothetical protein